MLLFLDLRFLVQTENRIEHKIMSTINSIIYLPLDLKLTHICATLKCYCIYFSLSLLSFVHNAHYFIKRMQCTNRWILPYLIFSELTIFIFLKCIFYVQWVQFNGVGKGDWTLTQRLRVSWQITYKGIWDKVRLTKVCFFFQILILK